MGYIDVLKNRECRLYHKAPPVVNRRQSADQTGETGGADGERRPKGVTLGEWRNVEARRASDGGRHLLRIASTSRLRVEQIRFRTDQNA